MSDTQTCTVQISHQYKYTMSESGDKDERKREYNRLAQREFRRRRKEHMKNLEQGRVDQTSEQATEIENLRQENTSLKREIHNLKQLYGVPLSSQPTMSGLAGPSMPAHQQRRYSMSPSVDSLTSTMDSISGAGSPGSEMMPLRNLSMSSNLHSTSSMNAYNDSGNMSSMQSQPYPMVLTSSLRHSQPHSSPGSSGYGQQQPGLGPPYQSLNLNSSRMPHPSSIDHRQSSSTHTNTTSMVPCNRTKVYAEISALFQPLVSDPSNLDSPQKHLMVLRNISDSLPSALKPTKLQMSTPHFYGVDMIPSPSLRDTLIGAGSAVAENFVRSIGSFRADEVDLGQVIIWGDDPLNEMAWEFSESILSQWGWLLGETWVRRADFWKRQRRAPTMGQLVAQPPGW